MLLNKAKCTVGLHDWFTETDKDKLPVYRICQCCGKYQQPLVTQFNFVWLEIPSGTITAQVIKYRTQIQNQILHTL